MTRTTVRLNAQKTKSTNKQANVDNNDDEHIPSFTNFLLYEFALMHSDLYLFFTFTDKLSVDRVRQVNGSVY